MEIKRSGNRREFLNEILKYMAFIGGQENDF